MKSITKLLFLFLISHSLNAQQQVTEPDTSAVIQTNQTANTPLRFNSGKQPAFSGKQNQIFVKDNVVLASPNLELSSVESEISTLEALECKALLKRDTATLRKLWAKDFTLEIPLNEVVEGKSTLPYYVSYTRMVEHLNVVGNSVYSSGYELVQQLRANSTLEDPVKRSYFHVWTKQKGSWKIVSKHRQK